MNFVELRSLGQGKLQNTQKNRKVCILRTTVLRRLVIELEIKEKQTYKID